MVWGLVASGLAVGPWLHGGLRLAAALALLGFAVTRPGRSPLVWFAVAAAVVVGGMRADAIDRAVGAPMSAMAGADAVDGVPAGAGVDAGAGAHPGATETAGWLRLTMREALPAGSRDRSASALATLDGRPVIVSAPRFGAPSPAVSRGAIIAVRAKVLPLEHDGNDARLRRLGVGLRVLPTELRPTGGRRGGAAGAIDRFATAAQRTLDEAVGPRRGALLAGMALGIDESIGDADQEALRTAGLTHLIAASGGNIALVVALVMAAGWLAGVPDRGRLLMSAIAICAYVPLAGGGPSIQRAGVMGLAGLLALALGRERRGADALGLAAVTTLALDPRATLDVGWQLSFVAAAALIAFAPPLSRRLAAFGAPRWLAVGLACTGIATVATAPVMLIVFGQLSLIGLVANALVLPLVGVAVWSGALSAVFTPIAPVVAGWLAQPGGIAAGLTLEIANWSERRAYAVVGWEGAVAIVVVAALVLVVRPPRVFVAALAAGAALVLALSVPRPPSEPRLLVFDIGQGNAALLQDGTDGVLVDAGPIDGGVVAALRRAGVRRLRTVILSHPAADHDGGAAGAIDAFPTDLVLDGGTPGGGPTHDAAIRAARRRGTRVVQARVGQQLSFGRIALRLRWPNARASAAPGDPNDRAAVVEAQIGGLRALLPADAEGNVLTTLPNLKADVLIVSHHGSNDDQLPTVLRRLKPRLAVISLGTPNTYGHPTPATLAALRTAGVPTLRTDQDGTIDVRAAPDGELSVRRISTVGAGRVPASAHRGSAE